MNNAQLSEFSGMVSLVTGASRGIGRNIAHLLGKMGAKVVICDIDSERGCETLEGLKKEGISAEFYAVDLGHTGEPRRLVQDVIDGLGRLDFIINNARAGKRLSFAEETSENWDLAMAVNLKSVFFLAQAAIPVMTEGGAIINISSVSATLVSNEAASYQTSKAGLLQLTRYLAMVAGKKGIRVNAVLPGLIVKDEHRERYNRPDNAGYRKIVERIHPLHGGPGSPDHVAQTVAFLVSQSSQFITGQAIIVDGGLTIQDQAALSLIT